MDERLEKALDAANLSITFNNQKELIKQQFKIDIEHYEDGHKFTANLNLINFLTSLIELGINDTVLIDDNENPYRVLDIKKLRESLLNCYFQASNRYYQDFTELKSKRSIQKLAME
jgi:hypothetical protein